VGADRAPHWEHRGHFFAAAAEAMRRLLIEGVRRKRRLRHGGGRERLSLDQLDLAAEAPSDDVLALDEALEELARQAPDAAAVVKLRYFAGCGAAGFLPCTILFPEAPMSMRSWIRNLFGHPATSATAVVTP
jgi:hypothetical protein